MLQIDPAAMLIDTYGNAIRVRREPPMPRINDDVLNCSLFLYPAESDARNGAHYGGSGFLISLASTRHANAEHIYAVTNKHVIEDCASKVVRINASEGHPPMIRALNDWHVHPDGDDIAIHYLTNLSPPLLRRPFNLRHVPTKMFVSEVLIEQLNMGIGDEVFLEGRLIDFDGREENRPTLRFGHVSSPLTAEPLPIGGSGHNFDQDCFLTECRSLVGYSGSPVFIQISARQTA